MGGERCSFRDSGIFKGVSDGFLKFKMISYPWDSIKFTPKFTGIPSHVTQMADMELLRRKFDALIADIKGDMQAVMGDRGVGGSEYHTNNLLEEISESNIRIKYLLEIGGSSNGALVSDSEEEDNLSCSYLEYEESIVLSVDEKEE